MLCEELMVTVESSLFIMDVFTSIFLDIFHEIY
jgi:hypothetical protein